VNQGFEGIPGLLERKKCFIICVLILSFSLVACGGSTDIFPGSFAVADTFKNFYKDSGGLDLVGPALSQLFTNGNISYQYVSAGLMVYDPTKAPAQQFGFYPLAVEYWNISSMPDPPPSDTSAPYLNGHPIWEDAWLLYNQMGSNVIGMPLTGVITNYDKQRYEQYFEGLGFYRDFSAAPAEINLMPYGEWVCQTNCTYFFGDAAPPQRMAEQPASELERTFLQYAERPGYALVGAPISAPQFALDGNVEMYFENVIMYFDPQNPYPLRLRPLPIWLGMAQEAPSFSLILDWLAFREINAGLGYDVPVFLNDFIIAHGGFELVGEPIIHFRSLPDGGYYQCFTNMCLEYHPSAPISLRVRATPLGIQFANQGSPLRVFVTLTDTNFPANQPVTLEIYGLQNGQILKDIMFELAIALPAGNPQNYFVSPETEDGISTVTIGPLDLPQGSRVSYQACATGMVGEQECATGTFTIWGGQ
jgi:hypothetical protein